MRLTDNFAELFGYMAAFRKTAAETQPSYEQVRSEVLRLIKQGETNSEEYEQARYAVCAWIDETVMATPWNHRARWRPEMLQRVYYNSADAGEKFFDKLNSLGMHQKEVREVYYLCLTLGFKGRYCSPEDEQAIEHLKNQNLKLLFDGAESPTLASLEKQTIFPEAYPKIFSNRSAEKTPSKRKTFWMATIVGPIALCLFLFLIYRFTLYGLGENILRAIWKS